MRAERAGGIYRESQVVLLRAQDSQVHSCPHAVRFRLPSRGEVGGWTAHAGHVRAPEAEVGV